MSLRTVLNEGNTIYRAVVLPQKTGLQLADTVDGT